MTGRIIDTGQVMVDLVLDVPGLPAPGGDVFAASSAFLPGGAFNLMAAAARHGAVVVYAGGHGTGPFGDLARSALAAERIVAVAPRRAELDTGLSIALVDPTAERTFVSTRGAETVMDDADLAGFDVTAADLVVVSGYSLLHPAKVPALTRWLARLRPAVRVAFDPGPLLAEIPADVLAPVLDRVSLWSSNLAEAVTFLGERPGAGPAATGADPVATARAVAERLGRGQVVVRAGSAGCVVADGAGARAVPGVAVDAVDTNGAGDTHLGVLAAMLLAGHDLAAAALRANQAAAYAVTRRGPATAATADELDAWLGPDSG